MPGPHRDFLAQMEKLSNVRSYVLSHPRHSNLHNSYDQAVAALALLRQKHMIVASRYIIVPSMKQSRTYCREEMKGTGGTDFISFLRLTRDNTYSRLTEQG
jgi:indoleamine 2,3-dioxygenase